MERLVEQPIMKFGFVSHYGDARTAADYAQAAEASGWDGFFVWEPVWGIDAWVSLTAAAMCTRRIRLGTMLSPISRMRPWKIASETATLDNLSSGRVILSVGLGALETGFENFGEVTDRKTRAELLDEGLDILTGLWRGQPFSYQGKNYKIAETNFYIPPPPIQQPRIPIWVVGCWPYSKSMERALRYDGLLPAIQDPHTKKWQDLTPESLRPIKDYVDQHRSKSQPYDIIVEGKTSGTDKVHAAETIHQWQAAGATWWIEAIWEKDELLNALQRIEQGPPKDNYDFGFSL